MLTEFDVGLDGIRVHGWEGGHGFPVLMLHGSGPGASTLGNWRLILEPMAERFHVIAADLIGFGRSGRKPEPPYFDMDLWIRQARMLIDRFAENEIGIVGHSLSGAIALKVAARDKRITRVLTTSSMGARFTPNVASERVWTFPTSREALRSVAESLVYDRSAITDAYLDGRMPILKEASYADYFSTMFEGDKQRYVDAATLSPEELNGVTCDVTMIHGRDDVPFPAAQLTSVLAESLPQADVVLLGRCSHSPALEYPQKVIQAAELLFGAAASRA